MDTERSVQENEANIQIAVLQHLNSFYTKLIERKQLEISHQRWLVRQAKTDSEQVRAHAELFKKQSDCVDLYCYWLNELLHMNISYEKCACMMHQMMIGNCHWFLARYGHMRSRASLDHSYPEIHYDKAIAAYHRIFDLIENRLPKHNAFYIYLVRQFSKLIRDAKESINLQNESSAGERNESTLKFDLSRIADITTINEVALSVKESTAQEVVTARRSAVALRNEQQFRSELIRNHEADRGRNHERPISKIRYSKSFYRNVFSEICCFFQRICGNNLNNQWN